MRLRRPSRVGGVKIHRPKTIRNTPVVKKIFFIFLFLARSGREDHRVGTMGSLHKRGQEVML